MILLPDIHGLTGSDALARLVESKTDRLLGTGGAFCLGIAVDDRSFFVNLAEGRLSVADGSDPVELGCIAKIVTATLVARLLGAPTEWGNRLLAVRGAEVFARGQRLLRDIEPAQLLNHTHGLDDSLLTCVARDSGPEIDVEALLEGIEAGGAVAHPGAMYSYSNAGAWLWAALLEHRTGSSFADLVRRHITEPLGLSSFTLPGPRLCPAGLLPLYFSMQDFLEFCRQHAAPDSNADILKELRTSKIALPGWSVGELAACQSWKYFGDGWYGHNAQSTEYSGMVRIHPDSRTVVAMFGEGMRLFTQVARLFARILPEFLRFRPPRQLPDSDTSELQLANYEGVYRTAALEIAISKSDDIALRYATQAHARNGDPQESMSGLLVPAKQNLFFSKDQSAQGIPFLQFVSPRGAGYEFAWNGRNIFRRVGLADPSV